MSSEGRGFGYAEGGVTAPYGFRATGVSAGIRKSGKRDVALLVAGSACPAAAVYTLNSMAAAPIVVTRKHLESGKLRAVAVNAGNANACTGPGGLADAKEMAAAVASGIGCDASEVAVASTGVIGVPMPMDLVLSGIAECIGELDAMGGDAAAEAIMTTDTFPKQTAVTFELAGENYTVGGMAKGSGMIQPNMATMLGFVTTDAPLTSEACDAALRSAVDLTFNRITVDSDTSTNDMVLLMASGAAGGDSIDVSDERFAVVAEAIEVVCEQLARMVVRDGEGATKFIEVTVRGAVDEAEALEAARSIANSPLFKTAIFGGDANWGRVVMAVGKSSAAVDPSKIEVVFAGITTCKDGTGFLFDEAAATEALSADEIDVVVDLHLGEGAATVWTCDLSYEYVRINGDYRT